MTASTVATLGVSVTVLGVALILPWFAWGRARTVRGQPFDRARLTTWRVAGVGLVAMFAGLTLMGGAVIVRLFEVTT